MVQLLDVTLRDGGYCNDFQFDSQAARQIVQSLYKARLDYIEIGYRKGPEKGAKGLGTTAVTDRAYMLSLREAAPEAKLVVMLHPHNIEERDLAELQEIGISMVRVCIRADRVEQGLATVRAAKQFGLLVSANFVRVTYLHPRTIAAYMQQAEAAGADLVYFADSNGNMVPEQVRQFTQLFKIAVDVPVGFHAHNNLTLGLGNTLAAIDAGIDIVDASLRGMGRGAGNLSTEVYVSYLERMGVVHPYDLVEVLQAAEYLEGNGMRQPQVLETRDLLFGMANFSGDFTKPVMQEAVDQAVPWQKLAYDLSKHKPTAPEPATIRHVAAALKQQSGVRAL